MPMEFQKELIIQLFESTNQLPTDLVNFCERLETAEENFQTQGEGKHKKPKQSGESHQSDKTAQRKQSHQSAKPSEEGDNIKTKNKTYLCALCMDLDTIWIHVR